MYSNVMFFKNIKQCQIPYEQKVKKLNNDRLSIHQVYLYALSHLILVTTT